MQFRNRFTGQFKHWNWGFFHQDLKRKRFQKKVLWFFVVMWAIPLTGKAVEAVRSFSVVNEIVAVNTAFADTAQMPVQPNTIEEMKGDVLDKLKKCENGNSDAKPIVFDSNGIESVGSYQWQPHSFQHYWKKMTGEDITKKQAVVYALDEEKARSLAEYVIFETDRGSKYDWVNCTKWHDLDTLISFIKAHE